jgi:DNA polymerase-3 subunit epsilon
VSAPDYAAAPDQAARVIDGLDDAALAAAVQGVAELADRACYESAARLRDVTAATIDVLWRGQRLRALAAVAELVAAAPDGAGGWQLAIIRHGQLAGAGCAGPRVPPMPVVEALRTGAQVVLPQPAPLGGALVEETSLIARWLAQPGVRIVSATAGFASPRHSAGPWLQWAATARSAQHAASQFLGESHLPQFLGESHLTQFLGESHLTQFLGESHPVREQSLGGPGVDRLGGATQSTLPGRQPFGMAG